MTPGEIVAWMESPCPHTCEYRGECWECFTEAIDAATKPLREEVARQRGAAEKYYAEAERLKAEQFEWAEARIADWAKIQKDIEEKAEARNKALVEALRAAILELQTVGVGHGHTYSAVVIEKIRAALADQEERKQSLPKASEGA